MVPSFSRPSVSDDNPYSESLFKTLKYRPSYPDRAFSDIDQAREWVSRFVKWYNTEHLHSAIRFVTPGSRHQGLDRAILAKRSAVYEKAKELNPLRWSGQTRNWSPITEVFLNPKKHKSETYGELTIDTVTATPQPTASAMSEAVKQISNTGGVSSKNGSHSCPITNASESGRGLPRGKNRLGDNQLQPSRSNPMSRFTQTLDCSSLENLP